MEVGWAALRTPSWPASSFAWSPLPSGCSMDLFSLAWSSTVVSRNHKKKKETHLYFPILKTFENKNLLINVTFVLRFYINFIDFVIWHTAKHFGFQQHKGDLCTMHYFCFLKETMHYCYDSTLSVLRNNFVLLYWSVTVLVCYYTGVLLHWCFYTGVLLHWSVTILECTQIVICS